MKDVVKYFESSMDFGLIVKGIRAYLVPPAQYFILQLHTGVPLIATSSEMLKDKFSLHHSFKAIELTKDDLSFRIGDVPVRCKQGNPNLMPFI